MQTRKTPNQTQLSNNGPVEVIDTRARRRHFNIIFLIFLAPFVATLCIAIVKIHQADRKFRAATTSTQNISQKIADSDRQFELSMLRFKLVRHAKETNTYPTLAQLNDRTWRQEFLAGLDDEALRDESAKSSQFIANVTPGRYAYSSTGVNGETCNADTVQCAHFSLTAVLSDGKRYTLTETSPE